MVAAASSFQTYSGSCWASSGISLHNSIMVSLWFWFWSITRNCSCVAMVLQLCERFCFFFTRDCLSDLQIHFLFFVYKTRLPFSVFIKGGVACDLGLAKTCKGYDECHFKSWQIKKNPTSDFSFLQSARWMQKPPRSLDIARGTRWKNHLNLMRVKINFYHVTPQEYGELLINAASIILTTTESDARSEMLSYKPNQTKTSQREICLCFSCQIWSARKLKPNWKVWFPC